MLSSWHCFSLYTKFKKLSSDIGELIPIISDSQDKLKKNIDEYGTNNQ